MLVTGGDGVPSPGLNAAPPEHASKTLTRRCARRDRGARGTELPIGAALWRRRQGGQWL